MHNGQMSRCCCEKKQHTRYAILVGVILPHISCAVQKIMIIMVPVPYHAIITHGHVLRIGFLGFTYGNAVQISLNNVKVFHVLRIGKDSQIRGTEILLYSSNAIIKPRYRNITSSNAIIKPRYRNNTTVD